MTYSCISFHNIPPGIRSKPTWNLMTVRYLQSRTNSSNLMNSTASPWNCYKSFIHWEYFHHMVHAMLSTGQNPTDSLSCSVSGQGNVYTNGTFLMNQDSVKNMTGTIVCDAGRAVAQYCHSKVTHTTSSCLHSTVCSFVKLILFDRHENCTRERTPYSF